MFGDFCDVRVVPIGKLFEKAGNVALRMSVNG
jgi:hypothetical protein